MERLGVIGGMGPEATSYFYDQVIAHTAAERDQDHIDMVVLSHASMPDRTRAILTGETGPLLDAMRAEGFANYSQEWWHYTHAADAEPVDVPIGCYVTR